MDYVNELDLTKERQAFFEIQGKVLRKKFESGNIRIHLLDKGEEVMNFISGFIRDRKHIKQIAFSDGVTLYQLGLFEWVKKNYEGKGYTVNQPLERSRTGHYAVFGEEPPGRMNLPYDEYQAKYDQWYETLRASLMSDLLIISANAITMNGEIVSIDGVGNRVSGMIFGPLHVLCIVGRNKIVKDVDSAMERIHNYAAPLTYLRHNMKHWSNFQDLTCVKHGACTKCSHPESSCRNIVIIRGQIRRHHDRIHLIVVNQELGF